MIRNCTQRAWTRWPMGLLCMSCLAATIGCTQQDSRGGRAIAATERQQSGGVLGVVLRTGQNSVTIAKVDEGSPAEKAGLKTGDEVVSVNGQPVKTATNLQSQVKTAEKESGKLAIKVRRNGSERTFQANVKGDGVSPSKPLLTAKQSTASTYNKELVEATEQSSETAEPQPSSSSPDESTVQSKDADPAEQVASDHAAEVSRETGSRRHIAGYRGTQDKEVAAGEPPAKQTDEGGVGEEEETADRRRQLAAKPEETIDESAQLSAADGGASAAFREETVAGQPEVRLEEVEKELEEAKEALDAFISQRTKIEFRYEMERQMREFDDRVATLEDEVKELQEQLSEKQKHLDDARKKREEFVAEVEKRDPTTASSSIERRKRINAAWQALQDAYREGSSGGNQTSDQS